MMKNMSKINLQEPQRIFCFSNLYYFREPIPVFQCEKVCIRSRHATGTKSWMDIFNDSTKESSQHTEHQNRTHEHEKFLIAKKYGYTV